MRATKRVAIVTGGARRVGKAIALALAADGFAVVVHYHSSKHEATATVRELVALGAEAIALRADLTRPAQVAQMQRRVLAKFGRVDVLINNASRFRATPWPSLTAEVWDELLDANLKSAFLCAKAFGDVMLAQRSGIIINLADVAGLRPWSNYLPYSVAKAGLLALTRGLALALAPHVRVNAVAPGIVQWPEDFTAGRKAALVKRVPLGRAGKTDDVTRAIRFLIESPYLTGAIIPVDGGRMLT